MRLQWYRTLDGASRRAFWTSFAALSLDALNVQAYAFAMPVLLTLWSLGHGQAGLLTTVALVSSAAGGWLAGLMADRLGRLRVLRVTILALAISTGLCALADDFGQLLIARALQGFAFGAEWAVGVVFAGEMARPEIRGRIVGMAQSAWPVGWALAAILSAIFLALLPVDLGWRALFVIGLIPAALIFHLRARLRESETFLNAKRRAPWTAIFSRPIVSSTVKGSLLATGMHGGYWAIATWWPAMLHFERALSATASGVHLGVLITGSFCGYMGGSWLGDRVGRRTTLTLFSLGGAVVILLCTQFAIPDAALLILSFPLGFFSLGMYSAVGAVLTELFPTELRGSGLGFCYNLGRGLAGATPVLIGGSATALGIGQSIGIYVTCAYGLVLLAVMLLPETRGKVLESLSEEAR